MNRHIQTFHKEEDEEESNDEMENDRADESSDESSDEEDVQTQGFEADQLDAHLEKNEVFQQWLDTARDASRQARTERFEKYLAQGMEEADAKEKAHWKTTPEIKSEFFDNYETHLWEYKTLEFNHVHRDILHTMDKRLTDGVNIHHAIKRRWPNTSPNSKGCFKSWTKTRTKTLKRKIQIPAPGWPKGKRFSHAQNESIKRPYYKRTISH